MALDSSGGMVVNYFRNFREICRKVCALAGLAACAQGGADAAPQAKQVCILRAYCTQMRIPFSRLCPESFVFYPAEPKKRCAALLGTAALPPHAVPCSRKELANFVHAFNRAAAARCAQ